MRSFIQKTLLLTMTLVILIGGLGLAANDLLEDIVNRGYIDAATILAAPPFAYRDKDGNPAGFEVELAYLLGEKLGVEVRLHDYDAAGCIPALLSGRVDIIASRFSNTFPRATKIVFCHPWFVTGTYLGTCKEAPFETIADLNKESVKIGCVEASVAVDAVRARLPKTQIITYPLDIDLVEATRTGRIDAFANDELIVLSQVSAYTDELKMVPQNLQPDQYAYMVRADMDSIHLKEFVNMFFMKIMMSGEYASLYEKWIGNPWTATWELHPGM
jgi:polar amino acid transport system substrate-binding protein